MPSKLPRPTVDIEIVFMKFKVPITHPLCFLALFTFYREYQGQKKISNPFFIMAEYLETNILDLRLDFNCDFKSKFHDFFRAESKRDCVRYAPAPWRDCKKQNT